jgi:transposase
MEQATRSVWTSRSTCFRYMERMLPGHVLFRKRITRVKLLGFLAAQAPCVVAMEACAGAHYWAREIGKLGHHVRLIAPGLRQAVHQAAKERCRRCRGHL